MNNNGIENIDKNFPHHLLLPKENKSHMPIPLLNISTSSNNIHNNEKDSKRNLKNENDKILNNNINNTKSIQVNTVKQSPSSKNINYMENEIKELDNVADKLNKINSILNKLSPISVSSLANPNLLINDLNTPYTMSVNISPDILKKSFPYYEESITSFYKEFSSEGNFIIKGYAYNTSRGNFRNYNEDTITVEKIQLKKAEEFFYFFGIYDGHGGNGCSLYLKENLHNFIQDFSVNGIKRAIYVSENEFLTKKAIDENNNLCDSSGSCGIIAMIKNNQLIISNTGDSRIVLYKNGKVFFVTKDHKPDSDIEKQRIKKAGGTVYQSPSIIPIYQNGKKINLPWRVLPGRLSVSRTFGDIEAKLEKFGGKQGVIVPTPDVTEIELNNEFDFMVIGCDGIFDVLSNEDLFEIWSIVLKERKMNGNTFRNMEKNNEIDIDNLCGDFAGLIIKSALARNSFDNVSCIVVVFNINSYDNNKTNCNINNEEVISEYYKQ
jgi:protein phosphatase 2C family protein 2/3